MNPTIINNEPIWLNDHPQDGQDWDCQCARCGSSVSYEECTDCGGEGLNGHDCGEDTCCCLYPEDNVPCQSCGGSGGEYICMSTPAYCEKNPLPGREHIQRGAVEWFTFKPLNPDGN